eukprot:6208734-Pleurochrysis_carterae.AAC.1
MMSSLATRCRIGIRTCCQRATRASYAASLKCDANIGIILLQNTDDALHTNPCGEWNTSMMHHTNSTHISIHMYIWLYYLNVALPDLESMSAACSASSLLLYGHAVSLSSNLSQLTLADEVLPQRSCMDMRCPSLQT